MDDLIERLEKATGPDIDLDAAVRRAVGAQTKTTDGRLCTLMYTASIDAALTLVGYQREWCIGSVTLLGAFWAEVITPTERHIAKGCKTPAIALCIAALKARQAQSEQTAA